MVIMLFECWGVPALENIQLEELDASLPLSGGKHRRILGGSDRKSLERNGTMRSRTEGLRGKIESFLFAFREYDVVVNIEAPENVGVAAMLPMASSGDAVKAIKTMPLMTVEEGLDMTRQVGDAGIGRRLIISWRSVESGMLYRQSSRSGVTNGYKSTTSVRRETLLRRPAL